MDKTMKIKAILAVVCFSVLSSTTFAGNRANLEMTILDHAMYGALGDIYNSSDSNQRMSLIDRGSTILVFGCGADANCKMCATQDPQQMAQLRAANSDAYVNVGFNDGVCESVSVMNTSTFRNK